MYHVGFGDAFLLYGRGENLLVDLGSIHTGFPFDPVRASVGGESPEGLSLLLTHFHKDHWSGLHTLPGECPLPPLRRIYLPDIFHMRYVGKLDVVVRGLLSDLLDAVYLDKRLHFTLAELLREVLPDLPRERIRFLARGDVFHMGGLRCEVLWPRLERDDVVMKRSQDLRQFLDRLEAKLSAAQAEHGLWDTIDALANVLLRDFARTLEDEAINMVWNDDRSYEDLYEQAQALTDILRADLKWEDGEFRSKVRYYAEELGKDWNRVSLVFQTQSPERDGDAGALMTGDVPGSILTKLIHGDFPGPSVRESYAVIKAPHHGTRSHFCTILPYSQYICISNGEGNKKYQQITEQYEHVYGELGKKSVIRCTTPRCEYCKNRLCPYFSRFSRGPFYDVEW